MMLQALRSSGFRQEGYVLFDPQEAATFDHLRPQGHNFGKLGKRLLDDIKALGLVFSDKNIFCFQCQKYNHKRGRFLP